MVSRHWHARHALPSIPRFPASALALAIGCALAGPLAQAAEPAARAASRGYAIAGGKLGDVLAEFAALSGVQLVFDPHTLAGRGSHGLQGAYGVREGFARLLDGSGYEAVESGPGRYSLRAVPAPAAGDGAAREATLPAVRVAAMADARDGMTEHTGSYTTRSSSTATKLNLSPRETPQTLTVVTRQKMDDFALTSVDDVLEGTSTIFALRQGHVGMNYFSRGFKLQSQYDGIPNPIGIGEGNYAASPDTAFFDKIEILQGASGLMAGAGEPGGTINMLRKRPTVKKQASVDASLGSWDKRRLVADVSGSLVESGRIRGRMVALVDERDSFTKYVFDNKRGFYGIVEADLTSTTTIGASVMYQKNKSNDHFGVPMGADGADLGLPRSSFWGVKNGDFTRESTSYTLTLDQEFSAGWLLKSAYTHADTEIDQPRSSYLSGMLDAATGNGLRVIQNGLQRKAKSDVLDIYVNGPFSLLGRQHELMVGATTTKSKDNNRTTPFTATPINIYSFDPGALPFPEGDLEPWGNPNETVQKGMYAATRLNLADPLKLIFGARASWYEYKAAGVTTQKESGVVTPYAGLIYDFDKNTSFYVSYSDIFKPQSNLKFGGGTVDPIVGKNYELGVKSEFLQGRMNASAAIFRLEQTNLAQVDQSVSLTGCDGGRCFIGAGLIVSQGVDLGFNGEILTGWQVGAGYTYVQSKYGNGVNKGEPYETWKPRHILRAHTTYRIPKTDWNVGASVRTQSRMYTEDDDLFIKQGGYTVVGLMAKYRISKQAELGITVNNLFDRRYYESIGSYGPKQENFYGAPRSFMVNMKYSF